LSDDFAVGRSMSSGVLATDGDIDDFLHGIHDEGADVVLGDSICWTGSRVSPPLDCSMTGSIEICLDAFGRATSTIDSLPSFFTAQLESS